MTRTRVGGHLVVALAASGRRDKQRYNLQLLLPLFLSPPLYGGAGRSLSPAITLCQAAGLYLGIALVR
jgi:hypothetical protein